MLQLQLRSVEDDASIGTDSFSSTPPRRRAAPKDVADDGTRTMPSKIFSRPYPPKLAQNTTHKHVDRDASKQHLHGGRATPEGVTVVDTSIIESISGPLWGFDD